MKAKYVGRVHAHRAADQIIKGVYWDAGRGCGVGCTIHSPDHARYETELGIPESIARLEDCIFEGLPNGIAKDFPLRFLEAIPVGADLARVESHFVAWLLTSDAIGLPRIADDAGRAALARTAELWRRRSESDEPSSEEWAAARAAARDAARAAAREKMAEKLIELLGAAPVLQSVKV